MIISFNLVDANLISAQAFFFFFLNFIMDPAGSLENLVIIKLLVKVNLSYS